MLYFCKMSKTKGSPTLPTVNRPKDYARCTWPLQTSAEIQNLPPAECHWGKRFWDLPSAACSYPSAHCSAPQIPCCTERPLHSTTHRCVYTISFTNWWDRTIRRRSLFFFSMPTSCTFTWGLSAPPQYWTTQQQIQKEKKKTNNKTTTLFSVHNSYLLISCWSERRSKTLHMIADSS